jgi:protein ImuB
VPPDPLPADLRDATGCPVVLTAPDLLATPPLTLAVDGDPSDEVRGWAGPWPVVQRWWAPGSGTASRLQVVRADGTAFLLISRAGRWEVAGIYD